MPRLALVFLAASFAHAQDIHVRVSPDVKTGIESLTEYPTIQMAMDHAPDPGTGRVFVHIYPGTYHERVIVTQLRPRMTLIGMGSSPSDVVITNALNAKQAGGTYFTQTLEINAPDFAADNLTIENSAGNTGQAVAAAVRSDRAIFKHVRFLGHQDTLFADFGRQFYTACYIAGGVDFIFGNATAVFDHTEIHALAPGYLTAQSRIAPTQTTGFVIANSRVTASIEPPGTTSLGRPWRPYSRVVYLNTDLPAALTPTGWNNLEHHRPLRHRLLRRIQINRPRSLPHHPRPLVPPTHPRRSPRLRAQSLPPRLRQLEPRARSRQTPLTPHLPML